MNLTIRDLALVFSEGVELVSCKQDRLCFLHLFTKSRSQLYAFYRSHADQKSEYTEKLGPFNLLLIFKETSDFFLVAVSSGSSPLNKRNQ